MADIGTTIPGLPGAPNELAGLAGLDLALYWARLGHRVLPVGETRKHPLIKAWQENCTCDEATIREWWTRYPNARVGLATGAPGPDVVDFDVSEGKPGLEQRRKLVEAGVIDGTRALRLSTPSGGEHWWFAGSQQHNKQNEKAIPGVDFRGVGGMVLAPGNPGYSIKGDVPRDGWASVDWLAVAAALAPPMAPPMAPAAQPATQEAPARPIAPPAPPASPVARPGLNMMGVDAFIAKYTGSKLVAPASRFDNPVGEESPLDWYVRHHDLGKLLVDDGWMFAGTSGGRDHYSRPGKRPADGVSANVMINADGRQTLFNFSTTVDYLPTDRAINAAQWYAYRYHGGDMKAAASQIRRTMMSPPAALPMGLTAQPVTQEAPVRPAAPLALPGAAEGTGDGKAPVRIEDSPGVCDFWKSEPWLSELYFQAQLAGVSPWLVYGVIMAWTAVEVGPHVRLPGVGNHGPMSLNTFIAMAGSSGEGKGEAIKVAASLLGGRRPRAKKPGTGQGLVSVFTEGTTQGPVQVEDAAWVNEPEITGLAAHDDMKGSNLVSVLCSIYSGEQLGEHYAEKIKRRETADQSYRLALTVGVQPANADVLFKHENTGLPQRFLWFPALWGPAVLPEGQLVPPAPTEVRLPALPDAYLPASRDPALDGEAWAPSDAVNRKPGLQAPAKKDSGPIQVPVKDEVIAEYDAQVWRDIKLRQRRRLNEAKRRREQGDYSSDPNSHLLLSQIKLAMMHAIYTTGRAYLTWEIWRRIEAGPMAVSADTLAQSRNATRQKESKKTEARAHTQVKIDRMRAEAADDAQEAKERTVGIRSAEKLRTKLKEADDPEGWVPYKLFIGIVGGRDHKVVPVSETVARMVATGELEKHPEKSAYRLVRR